jgi:hypothetical protein
MSTIGDFLVGKVQNMHRWLSESCENYNEGLYAQKLALITPQTATLMGEILLQHKSIVYHRDWYRLHQLTELPAELRSLAEVLKPQSELHDKFWRYLELFVESVSSSD